MTGPYEHEDVIYHEPLPRIVLANFPEFTTKAELAAASYNVRSCSVQRVDQFARLSSPVPPHDVDVFLVADRPARFWAGQPPKQYSLPFSGSVLLPSGFEDSLQVFCAQVLGHGGVCVFFIGDPNGSLLRNASLLVTPDPRHKLWSGQTAHREPNPSGFESVAGFVSRHLGDSKVCVGLNVDPSLTAARLIEDAASVPYAVAIKIPGSRSGLLICVPDYGDRTDVLNDLLSAALPDLAPHLFPFRHDLSWMKEPDFRHPEINAIEDQKNALRKELHERIEALDKRIELIKQDELYLQSLLTTDGDLLKSAVKEALQQVLSAAGVADAQIIDSDLDPSLRDSETKRREDLRIEWRGKVILVNAAGRAQHLRPTSINQLDQHQRLFLRANPTTSTENVHSVLIANFNYKG